MKEAEEEGAEGTGAAEGGWVAEQGVVVVETKRKSEQWVLFCFLAKCLPVGLNFYPEYFCFNSVKCGLPKNAVSISSCFGLAVYECGQGCFSLKCKVVGFKML